MVVSLSSAGSVVNAALVRIGYKKQIGNLHDGSEAAQLAVQVYGQTRDTLMRTGNFDFPQREVTLTLLKSSPLSGYIPGFSPWDPATNPQIGYKFEYAYPTDCLKLNSVRPVPIFVPEFDPSPYPFKIANDNAYTPARRVVLCNLADAVGTYVGRIADPTIWPADFTEALIEALGERLAPALTTMDAAKAEAAESRAGKAEAMMERG